MSRKLSEQDLYALFDQLNTDDMPSGMASRIEQQVLAEVNSTLQPGVVTVGRGSGWFATMFSNIRMPSLQLLPSFAMGAAAAVVILVLMLNPELINRLIGIEGPQTGSAPGDTIVVPTAMPTDTPLPISTPTVDNGEVASASASPVATEVITTPATETPSPTPASSTTEDDGQEPQSQSNTEGNDLGAQDETDQLEADDLVVPAYPVPGISDGDETIFGGNNSSVAGENDELSDPPTLVPTPTGTATPESLSNVAQLPPTITATSTGSEESNSFDDRAGTTATATRQTQSAGAATATATGSQTATAVPTSTNTRAIGTVTSTPTSSGIRQVTPTNTATSVTSGPVTGQIITPSPTPSLTPTTIIPTRTPSRTPTTAPTSTDVEGDDGSRQPVLTRTPTKTTKTPTKTPTREIAIRPVTSTPVPNDTSTPAATLTPTGTKTPTPTETVNRPPEAADYTVDLFEDGEVTFNLREKISDPDGDSVSISIMKEPDYGVLSLQNGSIVRYKPVSNFNGEDLILVQVKDSNGLVAVGTVTFAVAAVNDLPETVSDNYQVAEDRQIPIDALANDSDPDGDALSIVSVGEPAYGSLSNLNGKLNYIPNPNFHGDDSFTYVVSDGIGQVSSVVNIQVVPSQDPPSAVDDTFVIDEDTVAVLTVLENDFDVDGDPIQITPEIFNVSAGTAEIINEGTEIRYTPAKNANGNAQLSYRITDGNDTDVALVTIQINPVPDAPQAVDDVIATEDNRQIPIQPLDNDIDVDGDVLTLTGIVTPPTNGVAEIQANNIILYTPNLNFDGSDVLTYSVKDASGRTSQARITVNVTDVNLPPVAVPDSKTGPEDQPLSINVLANDTDPDGDTLKITTVSESSNGTITIEGGSLTLVPNPNFNGVIEVTYGISDGNSTAQAVAIFTITPVEDAPTAQDDLGAGSEDTSITVPVLQNDIDVDGDPLSIVAIGTPSFGTVTQTADGRSILYTPIPNFFGTDLFTYTVSDGNANGTATVQIAVNPVNDPPDVPNKNASMPEDTTAADDVSFIDVLDGIVDPESDTLTIAQISQQPTRGKATIVDNQIQYVPEPNFNGEDTIKVKISDGGPEQQEVTITITVTPLPDPPVAVNDEFSTREDPVESVSLDVLANDIDPETGNNSSLRIVSASQPTGNHQVTLNANNTLSFIPAADKSGIVTFSYKIVSGSGEATGLVTVNIDPVNDAPKTVPDVAQVNAGSAATLINVLANDTDIDSPREELILGLPEQGIAGLSIVDNQISYQPPADFSGVVNVTYTVTDQKSAPVNGTLTITVVPTTDAPPGGASNPPGEDGNADSNDNEASENAQAPIADPRTITSNGETVTVDVIGSQTGLTISVDPSVVGGTASVQGTSITITPTQGYTGTFNVGYNLSNGITTTSSSITVTVSAATAP